MSRETKEIKTGTIKYIDPDGTWDKGNVTYTRYRVELSDGQVWKFSAVGNFKKNIGETIQYTVSNEQYRNASLYYPNPNGSFNQSASQSTTNRSGKMPDTQTAIVRQSSLKAAIDFWALQNNASPSEQDVINTATNFVNNFILD